LILAPQNGAYATRVRGLKTTNNIGCIIGRVVIVDDDLDGKIRPLGKKAL
jgi:hypothetical protein